MRRLFKWGIVAFVLVEWYSRGGREFLFGEVEREQGLSMFRIWIDLSPSDFKDAPSLTALPKDVLSPSGVVVGTLTKARWKPDARDQAGYPIEQLQVYGEFVRGWFGHPINVAIAEAEDLARRSLSVTV